MLQRFATRTKLVGGQAHWQNGIAERNGKHWNEIFQKMVDERVIRSKEEVEWTVPLVSAAKNELKRVSGFSPVQWVLGKQPKLLADTVDGVYDLASHS